MSENLNRRWLLNQLLKDEPNETNVLALAHSANEKTTDFVIPLKEDEFHRLYENRRNQWQLDDRILVGDTYIPVSKGLLALQSPYFRHLLSDKYRTEDISLLLPYDSSPIVLEMILNGLMLGAMPVPKDYSLDGWIELTEIADYLCLEDIKNMCEIQLCGRVGESNVQILSDFAEKMGLGQL